jgi:hypothetical protein
MARSVSDADRVRWRERLWRFERRTGSVEAFCRLEGISIGSLYSVATASGSRIWAVFQPAGSDWGGCRKCPCDHGSTAGWVAGREIRGTVRSPGCRGDALAGPVAWWNPDRSPGR